MAGPESSPETTDAPAADQKPVSPTISVTRHLDPPVISPKSDDTERESWRPATDATPPMTGQRSADAPTQMQDTKTVAPARPRGVPDIPGYEILAEIGRGGMGVVYKARQLELNRMVALKMILGEFEREEQRIRFRLEAETAARVRHTNVVQVYDSGTEPRPYLVLEWVDGGTLSEYVKGKPQSPRAAARTVSLLARAIHATHCAGIVHRDLKPGNILVNKISASNATTETRTASGSASSRADSLAVTLSVDGQQFSLVPKVTDFGLAKEMTADTNLTDTGRVLGTPEYMAPEQAAGRQKAIGPPTDVYALGIILYQMLVGRTPFHDSSVVAIMRRVVEEDPKPPRAVQSKVPRDLETICLKCLQKDPARRYATAEALANDLDCFLDNRPIAARPTGSFERAWKWASRRPGVAAATAAAALFFVLGFAGVTWQWRAAVAQKDRAEKAEGAAVTERDRALTAEAVTTAVNHFVMDDLLETATPEKQLGRKITVEEVLQNASTRIDGRFGDQPEVAAAIRQVLGNSYRKLGMFEPADRHLTASVDLRRKALGNTHRDTLAAAADRGLLLADERKWDEAVPLLRQVVGDARDKFGPDDPLTIEATERLALVLQERGDMAEAEKHFDEALAAARRARGPADPLTLTVLNDYGMLLRARKKWPQAEAVFKEAADGRAKALASTHPATLESLNNLAAVLDDEGQWKKARPIYEQVLADKKRILGPEHIDTLATMNNLALVLRNLHEFDAALDLYDQAYEGFRRALGPENPESLKLQNALGQFYFLRGQQAGRPELQARGVTILEAVLAIRRRVLPPDPNGLFQTLTDLGSALIAKERLADAEGMLKEALAGRRKALSPGHPDTLNTAIGFVQCLKREKKTAEAVAECRGALADAEKEGTAESLQGIQLLRYLGALILNDHPDEALKLFERAFMLSRRVFGETADETLDNRGRLCIALMTVGRTADAEIHLRAIYDTCRTLGSFSRIAEAAHNLGNCLAKQKRYDKAEPLFIEYYDATSQIRDVSPTIVRAAGEQVVKLYEAWGKPEKVAEWREKLK
jgi:eukaryotic-like serine/threonine-protein kinase